MGNQTPTSPQDCRDVLISDFKVLRSIVDDNFGEGIVLKRKSKDDLCFLRESSFSDPEQFQSIQKLFQKRTNQIHQNIFSVLGVQKSTESSFCGNLSKIFALFEYSDQTLLTTCKQLAEQNLQFSEDQLWQILIGTIEGLIYLKNLGVSHAKINPNSIYLYQDKVKLIDPSLISSLSLLQLAAQNSDKDASYYYLSPQLISKLRENQIWNQQNCEKSDVFSLGITLIHASLLTSMKDCYQYKNPAKLLEKELKKKIQQLKTRLSPQFLEVLLKMIIFEESKRPNLNDLLAMINRITKSQNIKQLSDISTANQFHKEKKQFENYFENEGDSEQQVDEQDKKICFQNISERLLINIVSLKVKENKHDEEIPSSLNENKKQNNSKVIISNENNNGCDENVPEDDDIILNQPHSYNQNNGKPYQILFFQNQLSQQESINENNVNNIQNNNETSFVKQNQFSAPSSIDKSQVQKEYLSTDQQNTLNQASNKSLKKIESKKLFQLKDEIQIVTQETPQAQQIINTQHSTNYYLKNQIKQQQIVMNIHIPHIQQIRSSSQTQNSQTSSKIKDRSSATIEKLSIFKHSHQIQEKQFSFLEEEISRQQSLKQNNLNYLNLSDYRIQKKQVTDPVIHQKSQQNQSSGLDAQFNKSQIDSTAFIKGVTSQTIRIPSLEGSRGSIMNSKSINNQLQSNLNIDPHTNGFKIHSLNPTETLNLPNSNTLLNYGKINFSLGTPRTTTNLKLNEADYKLNTNRMNKQKSLTSNSSASKIKEQTYGLNDPVEMNPEQIPLVNYNNSQCASNKLSSLDNVDLKDKMSQFVVIQTQNLQNKPCEQLNKQTVPIFLNNQISALSSATNNFIREDKPNPTFFNSNQFCLKNQSQYSHSSQNPTILPTPNVINNNNVQHTLVDYKSGAVSSSNHPNSSIGYSGTINFDSLESFKTNCAKSHQYQSPRQVGATVPQLPSITPLTSIDFHYSDFAQTIAASQRINLNEVSPTTQKISILPSIQPFSEKYYLGQLHLENHQNQKSQEIRQLQSEQMLDNEQIFNEQTQSLNNKEKKLVDFVENNNQKPQFQNHNLTQYILGNGKIEINSQQNSTPTIQKAEQYNTFVKQEIQPMKAAHIPQIQELESVQINNNYTKASNKQFVQLELGLKQQNLPINSIDINYKTTESKQIGFVEILVENYDDGSHYEGEKLNGQREGSGRFFYLDGGVYDGEWKQDKIHGRGVLFYSVGRVAYDGSWENDKFHGFGALYNQSPTILLDCFDYRDFNLVDDYWVKYDGEFRNDLKEGFGTLFLSNGERFEGSFKRDVVQGPGSYFKLNGEKIEGIWSDNQLTLL